MVHKQPLLDQSSAGMSCTFDRLLVIAVSDPGFVGFSYAVSAMLNARLQRADIAVHDITWMAEHSAVEGKAGAREGPLPVSSQAICRCL